MIFTRVYLQFSLLLILLLSGFGAEANWFEWSNSEIQYLHGDGYRMPVNANDVSQSIITATHAHGWAFGHNFFFMDTLITDSGQLSQTSVYGEAYSYLSLSKLANRDLSFFIFKDLNAAVGVNAGENLDSPKSGSRVALYGFSVDFKVPGFKLLSVDFLQNNVLEPTDQGSSWQITPVWKYPFTIAGLKWSLEGFTDFIGSKGANYADTILSQPQLRLDVGDLWGKSGQVYVGIEYQYWHNKYGIKGLHESLPQALVVWQF